uniref:Pheromone binding protein, PBP n=1 Tax=Lymantria dispar TaxID=13123 RepID=Q9TWZ3_LYMDI|nr:pheromone binding protein, PBP [Lymantria dispar, Peptide, 145 aa] [Lymantria dispar]
SKDVMHQMALKFGKPIKLCQQELGADDSVVKEFLDFWKDGYVMKDRQTGCMLICMAMKLELLDSAMEIHHGSTFAFAKAHGADEAMAQQIIDIVHGCTTTYPAAETNDPCQRAVNVAMCFKADVHKLNWAPDVELLVADFLAESQ